MPIIPTPISAGRPSAPSVALDSDLGKLFLHQLRDTYFAEGAILKALPSLIAATHSADLAAAFDNHRQQTVEHLARLVAVFEMVGSDPDGTPCEAIKGILKEGDEIVAEFGKTRAGDAGLAAAAQAVEHYEIARYGALKAWAQELGLPQVITLLEMTETEELGMDQSLTDLSVRLNANAVGSGQ